MGYLLYLAESDPLGIDDELEEKVISVEVLIEMMGYTSGMIGLDSHYTSSYMLLFDGVNKRITISFKEVGYEIHVNSNVDVDGEVKVHVGYFRDMVEYLSKVL